MSYRFDQGELIEVTVDENGNFDQRFDVTGLSFDEHSLTLIATDEAGNITEETVNVTVQELTSLRVTGTTPLDGATEIGSTFRPQVFFSEPIDTSTLNENNFYASFAGQKLAANIVPGEDGTFAWLFLKKPCLMRPSFKSRWMVQPLPTWRVLA
ncbi:hypothetical protein CWATWH0402_4993 [Crocosphaera watsonii WH 0402]|uniref:SbsA Ig-like domain-containing protein n=1 Tax=Crocosphaera watsonii WH 0402 TaxID=1284629 RepID=T2K0M3_CROWT|nr:hypothetical protein CWATWH0402_4993 [Crocosphaera watsonii WH 0402]